jgi:hypothetical protein
MVFSQGKIVKSPGWKAAYGNLSDTEEEDGDEEGGRTCRL